MRGCTHGLSVQYQVAADGVQVTSPHLTSTGGTLQHSILQHDLKVRTSNQRKTLHTTQTTTPTTSFSIMGSIDQATPPSSTIPIIDFAAWSNSSDACERFKISKALITAFQTVGFVYLINHGLPQPLLDQAFATSKRLFDLPLEQKMLAPQPDGPEVHRGYSHPGLEKVSQYTGGDVTKGEELRNVLDYKESYEIGSEENASQPNIRLPGSVLPDFRPLTTNFYWACNDMAQEILRCIGLGLGLEDAEYLIRYHSGHNNQPRLLHYPPVPAGDVEQGKVARMPAHSDWGSITMLFQDDCGGLEVEDAVMEGRFVSATPIRGACVVNVGDLLMRWSNGEFYFGKARCSGVVLIRCAQMS